MKTTWKLHPFFDDPPAQIRPCGHKGCTEAGEYRAPVSPLRLNEYYWFCLDHVREYNLNWDYYKRMTQDEIERSRREDITWERPVWRFGLGGKYILDDINLDDPFSFFATRKKGIGKSLPEKPSFPPGSPEAKALSTLEFESMPEAKKLKKRYRELARKYHPDLNNGCVKAQEKIKDINHAFSILRKLTQ